MYNFFRKGEIMEVKIADNFKDKLIGLMNKKDIDYALLITNCKSIHTFFMKEAIDVLLLDNNNRILMINRNVVPNKILVFHNKNKTNILEMPNNSSLNLKVNDVLDLSNLNI